MSAAESHPPEPHDDATVAETVDPPAPADAYRAGLAERWMQWCTALADFHQTFHRWPASSVNDPVERRLGEWLVRHRTQFRKGTLAAERLTALEAMSAGVGADWKESATWWTPSPAAEEEPAPGITPTDAPTDTPSQETTHATGAEPAPPLRNNLLAGARWRARQGDVEDFYRTHQRWPRTSSEDPDEARLGQWLARTRTRQDTLRPEYVVALDEMSSRVEADWRQPDKTRNRFEALVARWENRRAAVEDFYRLHDRWPHPHSEDTTEARLGRWLATERTRHRKGNLPPEEAAPLTKMSERLGVDWTESPGRYSRSDDSEPEHIAPLAVVPPLDEDSPPPRPAVALPPSPLPPPPPPSPTSEDWEHTRVRVEDFYRTHRRWPWWTGLGAERELGAWVAEVRDQSRRNLLSREQREALNEMVARLGVPLP